MDSKNAAPYEAAFFCGFDLERHGAFIDLAFIPPYNFRSKLCGIQFLTSLIGVERALAVKEGIEVYLHPPVLL